MSSETVTLCEAPERHTRLFKNVQTLFHPTEGAFAGKLEKDGRLLRGPGGFAGPGIYFADTEAGARELGTGKGVVLKCTVMVGVSKTITEENKDMTFTSLVKDGLDSVRYTDSKSNNSVYVVYNWDQAYVVETLEEPATKAGKGVTAEKAVDQPVGGGDSIFRRFIRRICGGSSSLPPY